MDLAPRHASRYRRDDDEDYYNYYPSLPAASSSGDGDALLFLAVPAGWLVRLAAFAGERVTCAVLSLFVLPVAALVGKLRAAPATAASLARRAAWGAFAAACTFAALVAAFVFSALIGFVLVRHWVEEPVTVRQPLYFDYTEGQPSAAVELGGGRGTAMPAGHAVRVSMSLLLPDSHYNRDIGVFQIKAEAISVSGITIASTTQPYMIRYKSSPVRLMQTAMLAVPLTMGMRSESQSTNLKLLSYKEGHGRHKRTELIRVLLQPRAMTAHLPQVYKAEITVRTSLPWTKELARALKWTMCVWASFSVYIVIIVLAICWVRPLALSARDRRDRKLSDHRVNGKRISDLDRRNLGERSGKGLSGGVVVKWRDRMRKRNARLGVLQGDRVELKITEVSTSGVSMVDTPKIIDDPVEFAYDQSPVPE